MSKFPRGRPRKYAQYERLVAELPKRMTKRPKYVDGIGVFRGDRGETAWVKVRFPRGGTYKGKAYPPGSAIELKLGKLASWSWAQLEEKQAELQGKADRGEALDEAPLVTFDTRFHSLGDSLGNAEGRNSRFAVAGHSSHRQWPSSCSDTHQQD